MTTTCKRLVTLGVFRTTRRVRLELAQASQLPLVTEYITRRAVDAASEALSQALGQAEGDETINNMMSGLSAGFKGLRDVKHPPVGARPMPINHPLATPIAQILGDAGAVTAMLAKLDNAKAKPADRQTALRGLASQERDALKGRLVGLLDDKALELIPFEPPL